MWVRTGSEGLVEVSSGTAINIVVQNTQDKHTIQLAPVGGANTALARDLTHAEAQKAIDRLAQELKALDLAAVAKAVPEEAEPVA